MEILPVPPTLTLPADNEAEPIASPPVPARPRRKLTAPAPLPDKPLPPVPEGLDEGGHGPTMDTVMPARPSTDTSAQSSPRESPPSFLQPSLDFFLKRGWNEWGKFERPTDSSERAKAVEEFSKYWEQVEKVDGYDELERQIRSRGNGSSPAPGSIQIPIEELENLIKPKSKPRKRKR